LLSSFPRRAVPRIAAALVALAGIGLSPAAYADSFIPIGNGWQTYVNDRFGMSFDYPADVFSPLEEPQNGDGRSFASSDATLQIFGTHNRLNDSPASMKREMVGMQDYEEVTYSPSGDTWLVLSGYRGDRIFYEKYFFRDGVISAFAMEFPAGRKPYYAPIIERIEDSFRAD
jgi:hypothetical protein